MSRMAMLVMRAVRAARVLIAAVAIVIVAFALAANFAPQQALADEQPDEALQAAAVDESEDGDAQSSALSAQGTGDYTPSGFNVTIEALDEGPIYGYFEFEDSRYSDGTISMMIQLDYERNLHAAPPVVITGVSSGATWLKVPETIYLDAQTKDAIYQAVLVAYRAYKNGTTTSSGWTLTNNQVYDICDSWLEDRWVKKTSTPALKDLSAGLPVTLVDNYNYRGYPSDTLERLSFEESGSSTRSMIYISGFKDCTTLTSVEFPTVNDFQINPEAFENTGLTSVEIPSTSWGELNDDAFEGCTSLESVTLGSSIHTIDGGAFQGCTALTSIDFPDSIWTINRDAFQGCTALTSITWPNNNYFTTVDGFDGCTSLPSTTITSLPASVTSIGSTPSLYDLRSPSDHGAFSHCSFTSITIPEHITTIGSSAFLGCSGLGDSTIVIPENVQAIGYRAFSITGPAANTAASITVRFMNPDFMFTPLSSAYAGIPLISENQSGTEGGLFFNPFGNTQVKIEAAAVSGNSASPLKQAYDSYYVRSSAANEYASGEPMTDCVLDDGTGRREFLFSSSWIEGTTHRVTGTVPAGATVVVTRGGTPVAVAQSDADASAQADIAFSAQAVEGGDVKVRVSLPGYHDRTFEKKASAFTADWALGTIALDSFTPLPSTASKPTGSISMFSKTGAVPNYPFVAKVDYKLPAGAQSGLVSIDVPNGARLYSISNKTTQLAVSSGSSSDASTGASTATVPVTSGTGSLFVRMSLPTQSEYELTGAIACDGAVNALQSLAIDCRAVHIVECPDVLSPSGDEMRLTTAPNASVVLKVGDEVLGGPVQANAAGTAAIKFNPPANAVAGEKYTLTAEANGGSATKTTTYKLLGGAVASWTVKPGEARESVLWSLDKRTGRKSYTVVPRYKSVFEAFWQFTIEAVSNAPLSDKIRVDAYDASGALTFSTPLYVAGDETNKDGQHEYKLIGTGVEQDFFEALEKHGNSNDFEFTRNLPRLFVLTDDAELYCAVSCTAIIDPSGTVFEAVPSNPLSGVTATIRTALDSSGTAGRDWEEAPEFDQATSIVTGEDGTYAWDVPEGWWQVSFSKEGYLNAATDWMEVQPPRLGLQTGLVAKAPPQVEAAYAYNDVIEIDFSQYMKTGTDETGAPDEYSDIVVTIDGAEVPADRLEWVDLADSLENEPLSRTLYVKASAGASFNGSVVLSVANARNYTGNAMSAPYSSTLSVMAQRPATITVANALESDAKGQYDTALIEASGLAGQATVYTESEEGTPIAIKIVDTKGTPIPNATLNVTVEENAGVTLGTAGANASGLSAASADDASQASSPTTVTTDASGVATVNAFGVAPGVSKLSVAVASSSLSGDALLVMTSDSRPEPSADNPTDPEKTNGNGTGGNSNGSGAGSNNENAGDAGTGANSGSDDDATTKGTSASPSNSSTTKGSSTSGKSLPTTGDVALSLITGAVLALTIALLVALVSGRRRCE